MATLVEALESTAAALARDDAAAALAEIIAAWRIQHCSRIGVLAGRISERASAGRTPIAGKTVKARLAAWFEAERAHDLVDVERLLADPWPTQWRDASPRFERIAAWDPDPRVAALLIRAFVDPPYTSAASYGLRTQLLRHLIALEDPRARDVVEKHAKEPPNYDLIDRLEPNAETLVAALEARFATSVQSESASKKTAAEFLEAIYAEPDELAHKAVFADWLIENGDPRGELMTLGMARGSKDAERRERALTDKIADDHAAWDWPVAQHFKRASRRYEEGFFAGGHLDRGADRELSSTELHPGWTHVRVIELDSLRPWENFDFLAKVSRLRELTNIGVPYLLRLLDQGALGRLEVLEVVEDNDVPRFDADHPLATTTKLPALKALGLACARRESLVGALASWPIVRRLERLMLRNTSGNLDVHALLASLAAVPGPRTIEVRPDLWGERMSDARLVYRVERTEAVGPFRRLALRGPHADIVAALDSFPEGSLDAISLDFKRATLRPSEQAHVRTALARFPTATIDAPFDVRETAAAPSPKAETVAVLSLFMTDAQFHLPTEIGGAMRHVARLGITFDGYKLGWANQQRALKPDPIKKAEAMTKADKSITLYADGTQNQISLGSNDRDRFTLELTRPQVDGVVEWVVGLIEDRSERVREVSLEVVPHPYCEGGRASFEHHERETINPFGVWPHGSAFAIGLDEGWTKRLAHPNWETYRAREPSLAKLFVRPAGKSLIVGLHPDPLAVPTLEEHQAFARAIHALAADVMEEMHGYRWRALADEVLGPTLAELGLNASTKSEVQWAAIEYGNTDHRRRLELTLQNPFAAEPVFALQLECQASNFGAYTHPLVRGPAGSRAEAQTLLERAAAMARADRAWFDNPAPQKKRR